MRRITKLMLTLMLLIVCIGANAEKKYLTFSCEDYCAAQWNSETNTLTWGTGGWNAAWTFMAAVGISGDLSEWESLHLNAKDFVNSQENKLTVVFKKNDGSNPPSGPTKEFVVSPDANGDITIDLKNVTWGECDITNIQDLTIYGGARVDDTQSGSVVVTDAYFEKSDPVDPLATQKAELSAAIALAKMYNALAYTDATFATLTSKIADGETALAATGATDASLTTAKTDIETAISGLALKDGFSSLKDVPFGAWNGWGADAELTQAGNPAWDLLVSSGQPYGDPSVNSYADVSAYDKLYVTFTEGTPRILMNRDADGGQWNEDEAQSHLIEFPKGDAVWSAKYFTNENGVVTVDLKQMATDKGFAHITAIKGANWANVTVTGLFLYKEAAASEGTEVTIVPSDLTAIESAEISDSKGDVNIACTKGTVTADQIRVFKNETITFSSTKAIKKIVFTCTANGDAKYGPGCFNEQEGYTFEAAGATGTWEGSAASVSFTATTNQVRMSQVVITLGNETVEPVHIANTAETAYTVAKAIELIDAGEALSETVFVKGIVSQVDKFDETNKYITYWISDDGTTTNQFECYHGMGIDGAEFASINDVEVGAEVTVTGVLTKYNDIYEFKAGNNLVAYKAPFHAPFADGKYYVYNVGTQKYLAAGANWGTHAVVNETGVDYEFALADGKYTMDSQISNGGNNHFLNGEWNDGAAMGWTFTAVEGKKDVYTISNGTQFLTAGEDDKVILGTDATADAAQWTVKTLEARIAELATATAEAPVNATFLIQDANFGRNDLRKSAWKMEASNQNLSGGEDGNGSVGNNCAESYHSVFTLSQTLTNAPAGKYKMTAQGFYRQDGSDNDNLPVFYANDKTATFPAKTGSENSMTDASKSFSAGNYTIEPIEVTVFEDGQLTVGAKLVTNTNLWCIFDNFVLSYVSKDIPADEFAPAYAAALEAAQAALVNEAYAAVTGEEKTALEKAISDFATIPNTTDSVKLAISTLSAATTTFTTAKAAYEGLATAKTEKATLSFAYATAEKKAAAEATLTAEATSAADATAKVEAITKAYRVYAESSALLEGVEGAINLTDSIKNPAAEDALNNWTAVGNMHILENEPWTDGAGNSTHKYFDSNQWGDNAWDITLSQAINLPAGKYMLTAKGRASADVDIRLFAGEDSVKMASIGASNGLFNKGWNDASVVFVLEKDTTVTIGVRGITSIVHNWMSFGDFRLMQFPAHTWDFTKWSDATVANLKADAAASKLTGWSDVEKKADAEADAAPTEASKDNCFWATVTPDENGELSANGEVIEELKGLAFNSTYSTARSLAIAVNYPVALSTYAGPAYLWLGGGGKDVDCFVIKNVKAGTKIKMGVESHKTSEGRGVQLFVQGEEGARGAKLMAPDGSDVAVPTVYEEQTWAVPGEEGVCNIIVYNTKGCHIYFIDAKIGEDAPAEDPEITVPDGKINLIANGNLATDDVTSYFSKEQGVSTDPVASTIVAGAGKNGSRGILVKSADDTANENAQAWDTQFFINFNQALPTGTKLHVEFDYMASKAAKGTTQAHAAPGQYLHWAGIGDVNFTTEWQHFSTDVEVSAAMAKGDNGNGSAEGMQSIAFNLAEDKTAVDYHFDNFGVWAELPAPVDEWIDLIVNGNMEGESMECFYITEQNIGGPYLAQAFDGIGKDGSKAIKIQSADDPDDPATEDVEGTDWDSQFFIRLPYQLPAGTQFKLSFDYKANKAADFDTQAHANPGQYIHWSFCGSGSFTTEWQTFEKEGTIPAECDGSSAQKTFQTIAFNLAKNRVATEFIIDNVKFEVPAAADKTLNPAVDPKPYRTGIDGISIMKDVKAIYNLNGQKVNKAQKGLYIINGKKVVVK